MGQVGETDTGALFLGCLGSGSFVALMSVSTHSSRDDSWRDVCEGLLVLSGRPQLRVSLLAWFGFAVW